MATICFEFRSDVGRTGHDRIFVYLLKDLRNICPISDIDQLVDHEGALLAEGPICRIFSSDICYHNLADN